MQLIQRSGVKYQAQDFGSLGSAICQLDGEPSLVPPSCFGSGPYWQYFHRTRAGWVQSGAGATSWMLHDGDMDGWHYAAGVAPPVSLEFASVCGAAGGDASATAAAPVPTATHMVTIATSAAGTRTVSPSPRSASSTPTPSVEALAPSATTGVTASIAATAAQQEPAPRQSPAPPLFFGSVVILLAGLGAWNFAIRRRR